MSFKTFVSMNIAIIGIGETMESVATRYALAGHEIFVAWKNDAALQLGSFLKHLENVNICSIEEAAYAADVIIIAAEPKDVREIAYWLDDVRGKVIIDASANFATAKLEGLNTVSAIKAITGSPYVVKVFSTRGYQELLKPLFAKDDVHLIIAGDNLKAKEATKILAKDLEIASFIDFGGIDSIPLFDAMTATWRDLAVKDVEQLRPTAAA